MTEETKTDKVETSTTIEQPKEENNIQQSTTEIDTNKKRLLDIIKKAKENIKKKEEEAVKTDDVVETVKYLETEKEKELSEINQKLKEQEEKVKHYEEKMKTLEEQFGNMSKGSKVQINPEFQGQTQEDPLKKVFKNTFNGKSLDELSPEHLAVSDLVLKQLGLKK